MADKSSTARPRTSGLCPGLASLGGCQSSVTLDPPPNRPDPATYSQAPLVSAGQPVTWASPDISFYVPPTYDGTHWHFDTNWLLGYALVTVRNQSSTVPAINVAVTVSRSQLGIGLPREPITTQLVSLAAGEIRQLKVSFDFTIIDIGAGLGVHGWETGEAVFIDISHPYDADTDNNHGECVTALVLRRRDNSGGVVPIPDIVPIRLGNTTANPKDYVLSVLPNSVSANVTPTQLTVAPGDVGEAILAFTRPANGGVNPSVTVIARDPNSNLLGGLTTQLYFD